MSVSIRGYRIHSNRLDDVEMELTKVRRKLQKTAVKEYERLLGRETAFLCDSIALNLTPHPKNIPIIESAEDALRGRIDTAGRNSLPSEYNFNVYAYLMSSGDYTYLDVSCKNDVFLSAFHHLEDYSLTDTEMIDTDNAKTKQWAILMKTYKDHEAVYVNLSPIPDVNREKIPFPPKNERIQEWTRQLLTQRFYSSVTNGQQIPAFLTMRYMDWAMQMVLSEEGKAEMKRIEAGIRESILDLDVHKDVVFDNEIEVNESSS